MPKYTITYCDEIEAKDEIEAYAILLAQLASDVKNEDVSAFRVEETDDDSS